PTFGADFAGDAGDFVGEVGELVDHCVDGVFQFEDFAAGVDVDLLGEVAAGDGRGDLGDVADLPGEVPRHRVHRVGEVAPRTGDPRYVRLTAELAFGADLPRDPNHLVGERGEPFQQRVHRGRE